MSTGAWLFVTVMAFLAGGILGELRAKRRTEESIGRALTALEGSGLVARTPLERGTAIHADMLEPRTPARVYRESGRRGGKRWWQTRH